MRVRPVDCGPLEMGWTDWLAPMAVYACCFVFVCPWRAAAGRGGSVQGVPEDLCSRARGAGKAARARVRCPRGTGKALGSPGPAVPPRTPRSLGSHGAVCLSTALSGGVKLPRGHRKTPPDADSPALPAALSKPSARGSRPARQPQPTNRAAHRLSPSRAAPPPRAALLRQGSAAAAAPHKQATWPRPCRASPSSPL